MRHNLPCSKTDDSTLSVQPTNNQKLSGCSRELIDLIDLIEGSAYFHPHLEIRTCLFPGGGGRYGKHF